MRMKMALVQRKRFDVSGFVRLLLYILLVCVRVVRSSFGWGLGGSFEGKGTNEM